MKGCTTALVGRLDGNSKRGSLGVMPQGFGPYLPLPRGDGLAAEKGSNEGLGAGQKWAWITISGAPQA